MIGIIPTKKRTYQVVSYFNKSKPEEGKLYVEPKTGRIFMYSLKEKRSSPRTGYFPIWDGSNKIISKFSHERYLDKDVKITDIKYMASNINIEVAEQIEYVRRRFENGAILDPTISDGDNMFTQCIKGILSTKEYTVIDLVDMSNPKLDNKTISNYYSALTKISFMRLDKWLAWIDCIFHMNYNVIVYRNSRKLLTYNYPINKFNKNAAKHTDIINSKDDQFKKIIKILIAMENITKNSLRSDEVDDYTINNMMTTLNSKKLLSAQLFSRFIRMANLSYEVHIYEKKKLIFEYKE